MDLSLEGRIRRCLASTAVAVAATLAIGPAGLSAQTAIPAPLPSAPKTAPVWTLTEDLRIGGAATGPASFSDVRGIAFTKAGTIFALDYKAQELRVYDAKGALIRIAAHPGTGPGEL